jgi:hypothetical protein
MAGDRVDETPYTLNDGLGVRTLFSDPRYGRLEMLEVSVDLATSPAAEQAIRSRAARTAELQGQGCAVVRRVERVTSALRLVAQAPAGIRLSAALRHLESRPEDLPAAGLVELAVNILAAVAAMHRLPGGVAHGAVSPAHIVITPSGSVTLTDCVFGVALETLARNREQFWGDFGLALPAAASLPRFDQRADVTQIGAVVLAVALRRPIRREEYPRAIPDLVGSAVSGPDECSCPPAVRMWLQRVLQLDSRAMFNSAIEAERALGEIAAGMNMRRSGARAVQALVRRLYSETLDAAPALTA